MEEYKRIFRMNNKLNSLVACTLMQPGDSETRKLIINKSFINPESTNGLHMMSGTYMYTNPPPYGHGSPAPYVAATVLRAYEYNRKSQDVSKVTLNGHNILDTQIPSIEDFPKEGVVGNFNPEIVWRFSQIFLVRNFSAIQSCAKDVINFAKSSNSDILSKGRQTWDPELQKSTTCSKAFNGFLNIIKKNLHKTPSTLLECFIYWYELYDLSKISIIDKKRLRVTKKKFLKPLRMRVNVTQIKYKIVKKTIIGLSEVRKWLDDYARVFCSYIKHAERGKLNRRAIASGSPALRMHLKVIEEFHLKLAKLIPGSTISIGGEEKKKKIINELQMSTLKENLDSNYSLQATEDATKWNECLNPLLFAEVHKCWFDNKIREINNLPLVSEEEETFSKICSMGFYYLLIKKIHLGIGFLLENDLFYARIAWHETKDEMLNEHNKEWFIKIKDKLDDRDYIEASPGFLMGMLNAGSTTIGLVALCGIEIPNTIIRCLRSSDDSMSVFVANSIPNLANLIGTVYSVYRLFGINPSREKTLLFPETFGEFTSWFQDGDFVGQYGVETSSLKPIGKNPQDDFNNVPSNTLQLMRTHTINVIGAISRLIIGVNGVRRLWNIKKTPDSYIKKAVSEDVVFLAEGGKNPWVVENMAMDESSLRYSKLVTQNDKEYFYKIMDPGNPFSEPAEETLLYNKDIGVLIACDETTPRNVFCYIRKSNNTNKSELSKIEAELEKANQNAFEIATAIDPSFLLTIPCSKTPLNKYLASTIRLILEKTKETLDKQHIEIVEKSIQKLLTGSPHYIGDDDADDDFDDL